jgi:hypothetical protein
VDAYASTRAKYPFIYEEVSQRVSATLSELDKHDARALSAKVARLAHNEAQRRADIADRVPLALSTRTQLLDLADGAPFCWICGWRFGRSSVAIFLGATDENIELPLLIDIYKPIGLRARHLRVEVDHVVAHSAGGGDKLQNLRLCCGWCNTHKSNRSSIYDVSGQCRPAGSGSGHRNLPQPFWVVRLLALEAERGIVSPKDGELTIAPRNHRGALNPANLMVVTQADDPLGPDRFQRREVVAKMWKHAVE